MISGNRELSQEIKATLPEAVQAVGGLYQEHSGSLRPPGMADLWRQQAVSFPSFTFKIFGLGLALQTAHTVNGNENYSARLVAEQHFGDLSSVEARHVLGTILLSRTSRYPGVVDRDALFTYEAELMKREVGLLRRQDFETLTFDKVVQAVLLGDLHLSRQS